MRAVVVEQTGGPEVLTLTERPVPEPGPGEISLDVAYAGVGLVDALFRAGTIPLPTPFVPGIEATGRVRAVGAGVDDLRPGQPVGALLNDFGRTVRAGGYAEVAIAHRTMVVPLDEDADLPLITSALINGVTAWMALHDLARARPSDQAVILGASGGLGSTTARLAALLPCRQVIGVVGRDRDRAPAACSDVVLTADLEAWAAERAGTVDLVIDPVGGAARRALLPTLAPFGRFVIVGNASGEDVPFSTDQAWSGTATITGLSLGGVAHLRPDAVQGALTAVITLLERGSLAEPAPTIMPLSQVREVHQAFEDRTAPRKTVLDASR